MARKTKPKLDAKTEKFIVGLRARGEEMSDDSERRAWESYIAAVVRYETAWLSDNFAEIDRRQRIMFQTFDGWHALTKHKIAVPEADIRQIILDALKSNDEIVIDLLSDEPVNGLEGHRFLKSLADDVFDTLKGSGVKIREDGFLTPPFCESCEEEMAVA